jgi:hypothetical protein
MKYILIVLAISVFNDKTCSKVKNGIPACIQQKINEIKGQSRWNPPAEVNEYMYQGKQAYLFTSDCCDQYIVLYDGSCKYICAPSGGITGRGDNKCTDFYTTATHTRLIWKDPR